MLFERFEYPKKISDGSFDLKLMMTFHISAGIGMVVSGAARIGQLKVGIFYGVYLIGLILASFVHKTKRKWKWPGVKASNLVEAVYVLFCGGFFAFISTSWEINAAWFAAITGLTMFMVSLALNGSVFTKKQFEEQCNRVGLQTEAGEKQSTTIKVVKNGFYAIAFSVWILSGLFFYESGRAFQYGNKEPDAQHTEKISNHGNSIYVTERVNTKLEILKRIMMFGIPSIMIVGLILEKGFKIPVLPLKKENPNKRDTD